MDGELPLCSSDGGPLMVMIFQGRIGHVLYSLDLRTHLHIHYIVLHLCDARQPTYYWCGVHSAFSYKYFIFRNTITFSNRL